MFTKHTLVLGLAILTVLFSCRKAEKSIPKTKSTLKYARGFTLSRTDGFVEIEVFKPYQMAKSSFKYLLVPKTSEAPPVDDNIQIIRTPISRLVCTSTSHIALLDHLNETGKLVGFPSTDLISSKSARARIDSGLVADLGIDKEMNLELLASISPEMVMGYSISGDMLKLNKIRELGIPVVINGEYLEEHPLGRAEWIKFIAPFFGKEDMADSIFNFVEAQYNRAKGLAEKTDSPPTVISGILYGDTWFLPGGQNYAARLFEHAGYNYLWASDPSSGFLQLSFESVFATGIHADYWIGVGSFNSLTEMKTTEQRYALFNPYKEKTVYTYDARKGSTGGSEYLELGYSRPDIVLKDLIKIAHPDLLPDHELFFHQKLR